MLQGKIPHGECFKFRISGFNAALVLVVKLAKAYCHLSAAGPGCRYNYQRTGGDDVVIVSESLVGGNKTHIVGITLDCVVIIGGDAHAFQSAAERVSAYLAVVMGYYH